MARTDRLLRLLHALRVLVAPVTAARLAEETAVSQRSVYRDIEALRAAGARIDGERGYGYRLVEDPALPPQMFDRLEIEALALGLAELRHMGDPALAKAAASAFAKIEATLPDREQQHLLHAVSQVYRQGARYPATLDMSVVREGCWREEAVAIRYADADGRITERTIWPLAIVYLDNKMTVLAWCCFRRAFRLFRADRIDEARSDGASFRPRRVALLRAFLDEMREESERSRGSADAKTCVRLDQPPVSRAS